MSYEKGMFAFFNANDSDMKQILIVEDQAEIRELVRISLEFEDYDIQEAENGVIGYGPLAEPGTEDMHLVNAGGQHVTLKPEAAVVHHADSFAMIRGGHLDLCVLGAFQVADNGDIANWATSENDTAPAVGGAMDLAAGAKRLWVIMDHTTKSGEAKLVSKCSYPLTAQTCVKRVYTNLATVDITDRGFIVRAMAPGLTFENLQARTEAKLHTA